MTKFKPVAQRKPTGAASGNLPVLKPRNQVKREKSQEPGFVRDIVSIPKANENPNFDGTEEKSRIKSVLKSDAIDLIDDSEDLNFGASSRRKKANEQLYMQSFLKAELKTPSLAEREKTCADPIELPMLDDDILRIENDTSVYSSLKEPFLLQLPFDMPFKINEEVNKDEEADLKLESGKIPNILKLGEVLTTRFGRIKHYKSGKMKLVLENGAEYLLKSGIRTSFIEKICSIESQKSSADNVLSEPENNISNKLILKDTITSRIICVPVLESFLNIRNNGSKAH